MNVSPIARRAGLACLLLSAPLAGPAHASNITLPPETPAILDKIYSFDLEGAVESREAHGAGTAQSSAGLSAGSGSVVVADLCVLSADFKYGMSDARRRPKLEADRHYFELAAKALKLAESQIKQSESAEMQFYAGMAEASSARLYGLRGENRNAARSGVRGREHLQRAKALDPDLADADLGLGLYNYYVDALSAIARILRFFMGIPGGVKARRSAPARTCHGTGRSHIQLARFYLALNLHRYDQQYEKALTVLGPLVENTRPIRSFNWRAATSMPSLAESSKLWLAIAPQAPRRSRMRSVKPVSKSWCAHRSHPWARNERIAYTVFSLRFG